jgi:nucleotide-binding universal stress UspA family protein
MYKNILVPVDGSWSARLGLIEAIQMAKGSQATLRLLHVVDEFVPELMPAVPNNYDAWVEALREAGRQTLREEVAFAKEQGANAEGVLIDTIAQRAADVIVEQCKRWPADLIVMGTHGRRGLRRMMMGSDAELVLRMSPVPVLLVREREAAHEPAAA